jgi:hypothetical protein
VGEVEIEAAMVLSTLVVFESSSSNHCHTTVAVEEHVLDPSWPLMVNTEGAIMLMALDRITTGTTATALTSNANVCVTSNIGNRPSGSNAYTTIAYCPGANVVGARNAKLLDATRVVFVVTLTPSETLWSQYVKDVARLDGKEAITTSALNRS